MTTEATPEPEAPPAVVAAGPGTRLEQLHAAYAEAKAASKAAEERLKAITDGIKSELTKAEPEARRLELRSPVGPPLRLTWSTTWRFDSKRFKADEPLTYVRYAKQSGSWTLRPASDSGGDES